MATGAQVIQIAKSQNGITERGYSNDCKFNTWFYGRRVSGAAYPWCAVLTSWVYSRAGLRANVDYPHSAGVAVCFSWYRARDRIISKHNLRQGDQLRYTISHTGIADRYERIRGVLGIWAWEGNTSAGSGGSQRDGGGVHYRWRPLSFVQYGGRPFGLTTSTTTTAKTPAAPTQPAEPKGILGMSTYKSSKVYKAIQKLVRGKWKSIFLAKGANSILIANGEPWYAQVYLTVTGLKPGETMQVRFFTVSYKKGTKTQTTGKFAIEEFLGTTGSTFIKTAQIGNTAKGKSGRSNRVRVQAWTNSKTAKITSTQVKYLKG